MSTAVSNDRNTGLVSVGTHIFKIVDFKENMGPSGFPYWGYTVICVDAKGEDRNKEGFLTVSHSPGARFRMDEFLDAMLVPKTGSSKGESFVGKFFRANITHKDDQLTFAKVLAYDGAAPGNTSEGTPADVLERPKRQDPLAAKAEPVAETDEEEEEIAPF